MRKRTYLFHSHEISKIQFEVKFENTFIFSYIYP
nr:MAG TPA: hypothetical protein [Bacteriophage sp.]